MKIKEGNNPKCWNCAFYESINPAQGNGWCNNEYNCQHGINGHKLDKPYDRIPRTDSLYCEQWKDAESGIDYYSYMIGKYAKQMRWF